MKIWGLFFISLFMISCSHEKTAAPERAFAREYQVGSYLWFQTSGEYRALCYQAYNLARWKLDRDLENKHNKKRAIVLDIDETILDNSAGGSDEIKKRKNWDKNSLARWVEKRAAIAIPGAREFLEYADQRQVEIFYISNRTTAQIEDTFFNLKAQGFPVKKENLIFMSQERSKEKRRQEIAKKYEIVMFFGDTLADFHQDFDHKTSEERRALVDSHKDQFGDKFIILPNPLYGDWEESLPKTQDRTELLKSAP